jgi:predicted metal-binding membrane protein
MTAAARERKRARTPILAAAAAAWLLLIFAMPGHHHGTAHARHTMSAEMMMPQAHGGVSWRDLGGVVGMPLLMVVAMMAPLTIVPVRHVVERSLPRRRTRSAAVWLVGYAMVWLVGMALLVGVSAVLGNALPAWSAAVVAVLGAAAWQWSPLKQRLLNRTHAHPSLAPFGRAADVAAARFGLTHGLWCVGSCWALMLAPFLLGGAHLAAMAAASVCLWDERLERPRAPRWRIRGPGKIARIAAAHAARRAGHSAPWSRTSPSG